jgi:hypothetical protein
LLAGGIARGAVIVVENDPSTYSENIVISIFVKLSKNKAHSSAPGVLRVIGALAGHRRKHHTMIACRSMGLNGWP